MKRLPDHIRLSGRDLAVPLTAMDRLVNWFDPAAGRRRFEARARMALLGFGGFGGWGGYASADRTRRANQKGWRREMDADSAIVPDLRTLREDSQHLARNNPLALGALKTNITKVVGCGLRVKPSIDRDLLRLSDEAADLWEREAEREWLLATETPEIDLERELPFSQLQALIFLRVLEDGDILVNLPRMPRPGSPYGLRLQLVEAARICNPDFAQDTDSLVAGVEKDGFGAALRYHVCDRHPGRRWRFRDGRNQDFRWTALPAYAPDGTPLALFLKDKTRPGQTRGVPYLAPVIELIRQLGRYTDAEVMAAVVSGMLTVFVYNETGSPQFGPAPNMYDPEGSRAKQDDPTGMELGYGSVLGLADGQRIETVNPARPNSAFDPFFQAVCRQIGMSLELPFEVLIKHFTASYSAARASLLDAWDYFWRRRQWLSTQLCQPIYDRIITEAVVMGRLRAPGFFSDPAIRRAWLSARWDGDAPGEIDPLKAVQAARERVAMRLTSLDQEYAEMIGGDHERIQPQIEKEQRWLASVRGEESATNNQGGNNAPDSDSED